MEASPWGDRFANCQVLNTATITANEASSQPDIILSVLDQDPTTLFLSVSGLMLYPQQIPRELLIRAASELATKYPVFAGRYRADSHAVRVECNNAGFPLAFAHWPQGSLDAFPAALTFRSWKAEPPCTVPAPFFTDDMNGFETVFNQQPLVKMRLTTLGAGRGCILSFAVNHGLCDGAHVAAALFDLAKACRGEQLAHPANGMSRSLLTPEGLASAVPMLKPLLAQVAASLAQDGTEEREAHFEEAWKAIFGTKSTSVAALPGGDASEFASGVASTMLEIPRTDLEALKKRLETPGRTLSTNDLLVGLNWTMRCILAGVPLPGQAGSEADIGLTAIDVAANSFPGIMDNYFGNTVAAIKVTVPVNGPGEEGAPPHLDYQTDTLLRAVRSAAVANRQALDKWRSGQDLPEFLYRLMAPNRLSRRKQLLEATGATGLTVRSLVSNMTHIGDLQLSGLDCGTGAPHQFFVFLDCAAWNALVVPSKTGDGAVLQTYVPDNAKELLTKAGFFEALVPNAYFIQ